MLQAAEFFAPAAAANLKYCHGCGRTLHTTAPACPDCMTVQAAVAGNRRSRNAAAPLALCLGGIGALKLYLGKIRPGILYLAFAWTLVPALISIRDAVQLFAMSDETFRGQYDS